MFNTKHAITIVIDEAELSRYSDAQLAAAWHVAQANPAPHADKDAGELAEKIGREIIRRFLRKTEPELWKHQGRDYHWNELRRFATFVVPDGAEPNSPREWTLKPEAIAAAATTDTERE